MLAWGIAPGIMTGSGNSAESAIQCIRFDVNPRHIARRTSRRACATTLGILPEKYECDGALLASEGIAAPRRVYSG